ncbi:hypothetical protein [Pedomonas mirosovicensis]|uniref:hypothetical protein n=1 Tax=Pedomonas mirosovicensis TaxID=2908641 RepID=UPI00216A806C|nr:hypothetical protein [Pedomonas mirosovicensis]MCH8685155.1 hypothetical protein [Pedomonas mirosovicensis]
MSLKKQGALQAWLRPANPDWATDSHRYIFPPLSSDGIRMHITKQADRTVEVLVSTRDASFTFHAPMPQQLAPKGLFVCVTWQDGETIDLQLGEEKVGSHPFHLPALA